MIETSRSPYSVIASVRGMGVAVITSTSGVHALAHQRVALEHAEAVLLVDHHEPQPLEGHVPLDQRVRAHREVRSPLAPRPRAPRACASRVPRRADQPHAEARAAPAAGGRCGRAARRGSRWAPSPPPGSRPAARAARPPAPPPSCPSPRRPARSRFIGSGRAMSRAISSMTRACAPVSWNGQRASGPVQPRRGDVEGDALLRLHALALERPRRAAGRTARRTRAAGARGLRCAIEHAPGPRPPAGSGCCAAPRAASSAPAACAATRAAAPRACWA